MDILDQELKRAPTAVFPPSPPRCNAGAQAGYLALEMNDYRYNLGVKYGLLNAQLALALSGKDRDDVLACSWRCSCSVNTRPLEGPQ